MKRLHHEGAPQSLRATEWPLKGGEVLAHIKVSNRGNGGVSWQHRLDLPDTKQARVRITRVPHSSTLHFAHIRRSSMARLLALSSLLVVALVTAKEESEIACQTNVMGQLDHYLKEIEVLPNANGNIKQKFPETIGKLKEACK